jgi:integrase
MEKKTKQGTRFIARWNAFVLDAQGNRSRVTCGPYELGPKVSHGPGLKTINDAKRAWDKVYWAVFQEHHPTAVSPAKTDGVPVSAQMMVKDFITLVFEPARSWEDNSRINWEYHRDSFLLPFFGERTLKDANNTDLVKKFMTGFAAKQYSDWTAKKSYTYIKALLDMSRDLGVTAGNAARLIPKNLRIPKGVKKTESQPFISIDEYLRLLAAIARSRDKVILKILFLCAVRRSETFVFKWGDFIQENGMYVLKVHRSFDSRTHHVKEWNPSLKAHGKVAVPPELAADLEGWRKFGDTNGDDPDSYIFPTKNDTPIIPTNWAEDILKPAGEKIGLPNVSYHQFRRGHATVSHFGGAATKAIQAQMRHSKEGTTTNVYMQQVDPETWNAVVELERSINARRASNAG